MKISPLAAVLLITALLSACAQTGPIPKERIAEIVASPERSAADRTNDLRRRPEQMLAFIGVRPGMVALDLSAGGGYTTELIARAVGPGGRVYAQSPKPAPRLLERSKDPAAGNITVLQRRIEDPVPPELGGTLDLVTFMFNYHDLGQLGVDRARLNRAVLAALKRGGMYVIADHSGRPGTGLSESGTLHRVEEAFLRREVEAAGFRLADEGQFLRNSADPRDRNTPEPLMPKDEFVLKFVKP